MYAGIDPCPQQPSLSQPGNKQQFSKMIGHPAFTYTHSLMNCSNRSRGRDLVTGDPVTLTKFNNILSYSVSIQDEEGKQLMTCL